MEAGALMPYTVRKRRNRSKPWALVNTATGKTVGTSSSRAKAQASVRARLAAEKGGRRG